MDNIMTVINVVLTVITGIGAYKSYRYYKKSKNITSLTKANKALVEVEKMLNKLPEILKAANKEAKKSKGFSLVNTLSQIGVEMNTCLTICRSDIPQEHIAGFMELQCDGSFKVQEYINTLINGKAIIDENIDSKECSHCQERLIEMQLYLKQVISKTEENLK